MPLLNSRPLAAAAPPYSATSEQNSDSRRTIALGRDISPVTLSPFNAELPLQESALSMGESIDVDDIPTPFTGYNYRIHMATGIRSNQIVHHNQLSRADTNHGHHSSDRHLLNASVEDTLPKFLSKYSDEAKIHLPQRGRTLTRTRSVPNPFTRAKPRRRVNDASIELNVRFMETSPMRSSVFKDQSSTVGGFEDIVLEPLAPGPICASVNEILESYIPPNSAHLNSLSDIVSDQGCTTLNKNPSSGQTRNSAAFNDSNVRYDAAIASAIRITQSANGDQAPFSYPSRFPLSHRVQTAACDNEKSCRGNLALKPSMASLLPAEILSKVYNWLSPSDFNSARHSCRSWYINSLECSLLETMLKRSGWHASIQRELFINKSLDYKLRMTDEWLMSKHLAKECALGPDWRGNGFPFRSNEHAPAHFNGAVKKTPFKLVSTLDFTNMGIHHSGSSSEACGMLFIVSACTKFLMVARGCMVFVYEFNRSHKAGKEVKEIESGTIRPITSIICPKRVLGCSMDTSSNRDAIAILMDGRMGLVCAITGNTHCSGGTGMRRDLRRMQEEFNIFPVLRGGSWRKNVSCGTSHSLRSYPDFSNQHLRVSVMAPGQPEKDRTSRTKLDESRLHHQYYISPIQNIVTSETLAPTSYPMPTETSPPTLYALLYSTDDPPRSIAICPQRRCVAFGCSSGIELHWIDALTGEDLNRWFPLAAPSDYLYFLPPRTGVDSAKKLRLVSSQGSPGEGASLGERYSSRKRLSVFWSQGEWDASDAFINTDIASESRGHIMSGSDHYRAVPLSDGYHLLFTDPTSGVLCLGSDAPIGGPTKLLRRVWFSGPIGDGSPVAYAAACDVRWGVRVVAAYGLGKEQTIWLFSVPADVFAAGYERREQLYNMNFQLEISEDIARSNLDWIPWWCNDGYDLPQWPGLGYTGGIDTIWPIQVRGQQVGQCTDLVDVAIHTGSSIGVTIWAFSRQGVGFTWKLDNEISGQEIKHRLVTQDGTVREGDRDGDIEMCDFDVTFPDAGSCAQLPPQQEQFDGTASSSFSEISRRSRRRRNSSNYGKDAEGDMLMENLQNLEPHDARSGCEGGYMKRCAGYEPDPSFEAVAMANANYSHYGYQYDFKSDGSEWGNRDVTVEREDTDLLEELTGVARIDIEIR